MALRGRTLLACVLLVFGCRRRAELVAGRASPAMPARDASVDADADAPRVEDVAVLPEASPVMPTVSEPYPTEPPDPICPKFAPVVRETQAAWIDGVEEAWRLEWRCAPSDWANTDTFMWSRTGANGCFIEFGEKGDLDLVRARPTKPEERMSLTRLFNPFPVTRPIAKLRRWSHGAEGFGSPPRWAKVKASPTLSALELSDYDHDGRSTEFLLRIAEGGFPHLADPPMVGWPCEEPDVLLVGVDQHVDKLHVLGTADHPTTPLPSVKLSVWQHILNDPSPLEVQVCSDGYGCDPLGGPAIATWYVTFDSKGMHVTRRLYAGFAVKGKPYASKVL